MSQHPPTETKPHSQRYAWFVVGLLAIAYAFSLLDRWILTLVVEPVKTHFGVSDQQMGILLGPVFAVFYITFGLPFGYLADRYSRKWIIGLAMMFWCLMTSLSGLAKTFGQLSFARFGVGAGEAALTPAGTSLVGDLFAREQQARAISVFNMGVSVGMGVAYLLGGLIVAWMASQPTYALPIVGDVASWQMVLISAGLPGLLIAALILLVREPPRRDLLAKSGESPWPKIRQYLAKFWPAYLLLAIGQVTSPLIGYSWQWLPTMFMRTWEWTVPQFSLWYGSILLVFGPLGAWFSGWLNGRALRSGRRDVPYRTAFWCLGAMVILSTAVVLAPGPQIAVWLLIPATLAGAASTPAGVAALVHMTPGDFRARAVAAYITFINGLGLLLGPWLVGWLNDTQFGVGGVRYSLAVVAWGVGGVLTLTMLAGVQAYRRAVAHLEASV
jgi:MFS family permease